MEYAQLVPRLDVPPDCLSRNFTLRFDCRLHCTIETCPLDWSYWAYRPSLPANLLFVIMFGLSLVAYSTQAIVTRRFVGFSIAMISGSVLEVLGYGGRVWAYYQPFQENPFLLQIVCLTIAPAFYAAGIYFCLSRIVTTFGADNSRLSPGLYPRIFIICDVLSLVLQATGGGMASVATHQNRSAASGNHIMLAGLCFQVFTLLIFIILACDFALKTWRRITTLGKEEALDPRHDKLRRSRRFKGFLVALTFATLCIFTRCVYRVAELSEGWSGHLIQTQKYFIGLEGAVVVAAVLALNAFHPGFCFREAYD